MECLLNLRFNLLMLSLVTWLLLSNILGESKLISWLGLLRKCLQTSEFSRVRCSLKRVMRLRLVWPMYVRLRLHETSFRPQAKKLVLVKLANNGSVHMRAAQ